MVVDLELWVLMSESGGIFTFPSTGIYLVTWQAYAETSSTSGVNAVNIYITIIIVHIVIVHLYFRWNMIIVVTFMEMGIVVL